MAPKVLSTILIIFLLLAPLYLRTLHRAADHLEKYKAKDSPIQQIEHLRKAISWHSPYNRYSQEAIEEMAQLISTEKEDLNNKQEMVYQLKRGLMSSRSFLNWLQPDSTQRWIAWCNQQLQQMNPSSEKKRSITQVHPPEVDYRFQLLAQLSFWGWIIGALFIIFRGFNKEGEVFYKPLLRGGVFTIGFYLLWLVSLSNA